jgi:peptidoglycan hydrolase CwlO-like protein
MDDFVEMEQLAVLQSEPTTISEAGMETMSVASLLHQISDSEKVLQVTDKDQDLQAGGVTASVANLQHQVDDLQKALADKSLDLQAANESCQQLNSRLVNSAEQIAALQAQNQANEASMTQLQEKLDGLLAAAQEGSGGGAQSLCSMHKDAPKARNSVLDPGFKVSSCHPFLSSSSFHTHPKCKFHIDPLCTMQASTVQSGLMGALSKLLQSIKVLAQAIGSEHSSSAKLEQRGKNASSLNIASGGQNAPSIHWKDFRLESAFLNLVRVTNDLLGGKTEIVNFVVELGIVLDGVMLVGDFGSLKQQLEDSVNEKIASQEKLEIAKREIAKYEEELRAFQAERAALESQVRSKLDHVADIESQIDQLISEKQALEVSLSQANEQVKDLKEQLHETKTLLENLPRQEVSVRELQIQEGFGEMQKWQTAFIVFCGNQPEHIFV